MSRFDMTAVRVLTRDLRFPEGPIALDNGSVLVVEIEGGALTRVTPEGVLTSIDCGGGPNGAALGPDGAVYVCNDGGLGFAIEGEIRFPNAIAPGNEGGSIQRVDLATGACEVVFTEVDGQRIGNLNDIVFDDTGSCYVVDTTRGVLYYADPIAGAIKTVETGLEMPNGMGLSPDGGKLYVSETYTGRLWAWDVVGTGVLGARREHYRAAGDGHWDGLAIDGAGNVCASNLEQSGISVISPAGELIGAFVTPEYDPFVTNICFGGPSGDTAYICSAGRGILYSVPWPWPGLRLNYAR